MAKHVYGARVLNVMDYPNSTSVLARVVSENGIGVEAKTVDIRVKGKLAEDLKVAGLAKHAQLTFHATGIAVWQAERPGGQPGDRKLPCRKDKNGVAIPGTETPIQRILDLDPNTIVVQLGATREQLKAETDPTALSQNKTLCEIAGQEAESLTLIVAKAEPLATSSALEALSGMSTAAKA